jgi:hypothetical protein
MGCCGGRSNRGVRSIASVKNVMQGKSRGVKAQKPLPIKVKSFGRGIARKTCPKCGHVMSHSILKYSPLDKTAVQLWSCTNKACRHKIQK